MLTSILAVMLISLYISSHLILIMALRISMIVVLILQMRNGDSVILYNMIEICTATKKK